MLRFGIEEETNKKEPKNEQFLIEIFFFFFNFKYRSYKISLIYYNNELVNISKTLRIFMVIF